MKHFQCRLVKRIDGNKIITFPELGKMYSHIQKTLKSHDTDEAIAEASKFNSTLPPEVKGMVIVSFNAAAGLRIYEGKVEKAFIGKLPRKIGTTEWLRFINRQGGVFELDPKNHTILRKMA